MLGGGGDLGLGRSHPFLRLGRGLRQVGGRGHHVHHGVIALLQLGEKLGQRLHGALMDVVQQQHALALMLEALERARQHLLGPDAGPVVGREVCAPDHDAPRRQIGFHLGSVAEAGETEERRNLLRILQRRTDRVDALVNVGLHVGDRKLPELRCVRLRMGADRMPFALDAAEHRRIGMRHAADDEEGRLHALRCQGVEHLAGVGRQRTVVEGEHDLVVAQRQGLGILHGADAAMLGRIDHDGAAGPERVRIAVAFGGARAGRRGGQHEQERRGPHRPCDGRASHQVLVPKPFVPKAPVGGLRIRIRWQSTVALPTRIRHWRGWFMPIPEGARPRS